MFYVLCSVLVLSGVFYFVLKRFIKPPEIPIVVDNPDPAYLPPEGTKEDLLVGGGLKAPEGFDSADRKPEFYTFLLFGLDAGDNTDTIMVGSYDGMNKQGSIISIPRDSMVDVKRNVKKINAAFPAGTIDLFGN